MPSLFDTIDNLHSAVQEAHKSKEEIEKEETEKNLASINKLPADKKKAKAYEMKLQGASVTAISQIFNVTPATIRKWLQDHASEFTGIIETNPAANIIAETLLFYENLESMCLNEIRQLPDDKVTHNIKTGEMERKVDYDAKNLKQKYIITLVQLREKSVGLMQDTGILPKEPQRLYHTMEREKPIDADAELAKKEDRPKEELVDKVMQLLAKGRHIS
jgi:transposase-like protein